MSGDHDHVCTGRLQLVHQIQPTAVGQDEIDEHQVGDALLELGMGGVQPGCDRHAEAMLLHEFADSGREAGIVVYYECVGHVAPCGS